MANILITGGCGFIGTNLAMTASREGHSVLLFDNLARPRTDRNLQELLAYSNVRFVRGDVRDRAAVEAAIRGVEVVVHLAAQVAVTTSIADPRADFEINAMGTFNVLEAARKSESRPVVIYASTNKVYGGLESMEFSRSGSRYRCESAPNGITEDAPLDFHSPYGCSKGAADQYVRDYARIYGVRTVVARQSCIYGPHQFGVEDQGWLAHFYIAAKRGRPLKIYGDGLQVRDALFVDDLVAFYTSAIRKIDVASGEVFNVGGGSANAIAVWSEYGPILERRLGRRIEMEYSDWRQGDQVWFVSDNSKAGRKLGWSPKTRIEEGIGQMADWIDQNWALFD